jgi:flagellar basal-body rod protein FlgB
MFDLLSKNSTVQLMDRGMTLATRRMELIAGNMANIDTPGYHARDFDFQAALRSELGQGETSPGGFTALPSHFATATHFSRPANNAKPAYERNDGNDVSLDHEAMNLSLTQQAYQLCSSLAQTEIRRTYQIIREGEK